MTVMATKGHSILAVLPVQCTIKITLYHNNATIYSVVVVRHFSRSVGVSMKKSVVGSVTVFILVH